jgi:ketosteroid isomerase-like protein
MRPTVHVAEEVGTRLGLRALLLRCLPLAGIALLAGAAQPRTPAAAVEELLAADRAASAASARTTLVAGLTAMMAPDVIMPVPGRGFADGVEAVRAELARDTLNLRSRVEWSPIRGGISADGQHGFTFGFMTTTRADGAVVPGKYLAYWVKGTDGWRVAGYKRVRRPEGAVDPAMLAPALPAALVAPVRDPAAIAAHRESVMQAERDFARETQSIGLRAGFVKYGSADAMNLGGAASPGFVLGNEAIARSVSQGTPEDSSPLNWGPERALVASSGDLGITFGFIEPNAAPAAGQPKPRFPFFTIWRRAAPGAPWRYVAE